MKFVTSLLAVLCAACFGGCNYNRVVQDYAKRGVVPEVSIGAGLYDPDSSPGTLDGRLLRDGRGISVGAITQAGYTPFASVEAGLTPAAHGIVLRDRNGTTARLLFALLGAVAGKAQEVTGRKQDGPKVIREHEKVSYEDVCTVRGPGGTCAEFETRRSVEVYRTDHTSYRPLTEAERRDLRRATKGAIETIFARGYADFELQLYSRDQFGFGESSGFKVQFMLGSSILGEHGRWVTWEIGLGLGAVNSIVDNAGMPTTIRWGYLGVPFRVSKVVGPVRAAVTFEWSWSGESDDRIRFDDAGNASIDTRGNPWHFDVSTLALQRIWLSAGVMTPSLFAGKLGYAATASVIF